MNSFSYLSESPKFEGVIDDFVGELLILAQKVLQVWCQETTNILDTLTQMGTYR